MGQKHRSDQLILRVATKTDLDDITAVVQAGFPDDPEFNYRFPYRHKYPKDNWKWIRKEYEEYLEQPEKFSVLVITVQETSSTELQERIIALAVWDLAPMIESSGSDLGIDVRRDVNREHFKEFAKCLVSGFNKYFARYGNKQYHLWLLVTHPEYRRRGAGTMLCRWGMCKAVAEDYVVTVLGSPMGTSLYQHLGFNLVGSVVAHVKSEAEKLTVSCLEYRTHL